MPIYEYQCDRCGHRVELMQRIGDAPVTDCPECQASTLRKLVSAASFRLKGTGWYATDFKGAKQSPPKTDKSKDESTSTGSGDGAATSEAKPAVKKPAVKKEE